MDPGALVESDDRFCLTAGIVYGGLLSEFDSWAFVSSREVEFLCEVKI